MKCEYCGEEEATKKIANPNLDMGEDINWQDENSWWLVCKDRKEVIKLQQFHSFGVITNNEKIVNDTNRKLMEIAERTKKPIMIATIRKKKDGYDVSSIEFTGKVKNANKHNLG